MSSRPGFQPSGLQQVSPIGAYFHHWVNNGPTNGWTLGYLLAAQYSQVPVNKIADCSDLACVTAATTTYNLSFNAPTDVPSITVCFDNATIVTMKDQNEIINNGRIVVQGDRITAVYSLSPSLSLPLPLSLPLALSLSLSLSLLY